MAQEAKRPTLEWTEVLPEEGRKLVEECLDRIRPQGWRERCDIIQSILAADNRNAGFLSDSPEVARFLSGAIVAAIIERLDTPLIVEADQAQLFAMSANPDHQTAACDWFIAQCAGHQLTSTPSAPVTGITVH